LLAFSVSAQSTVSGSVLEKCKLFWYKINFELKFANTNGCKISGSTVLWRWQQANHCNGTDT